jgi:hypothetical protein
MPKTYIAKLQEAIKTCRRLTEPMRQKRQIMLKEYASGFYGNELHIAKKPLNMVFRGMSIMIPLLAAQNPKVMIRARVAQLRPFAETFRLTLNKLIEEINLVETLRNTVVNSQTYMGITKTGITDGGPLVEDAFGYLHDAGQLYCDNVDGDDYIWDVAARVQEEMDFEGNRYRVPFEYVTDSGLYKNYDKLKTRYKEYGEKGKRPEDIAKETIHNFEINEVRPYVELYDLWIPHRNIIVTIPCEGQGDKELRVSEWGGPEKGPYDLLAYNTFPESIVPIPPVYTYLDLHHYINTMARKMGRRADREKRVMAYEGVAEEDARAIKEAEDDEFIRVDSVDRIKELEFGGNNEDSYNYMVWLMTQWSQQGGNLSGLGGRYPQAETLGQEQMLLANASAGVDDQIWKVHHFTSSILKKMAWFIWTDPTISLDVSKRVPGTEGLEVRFSPEAREGDFLDYNFDVEPYSMQRMNPMMRRQAIMELVTGLVLPTLEISAMQGAMVDVPALIKSIARDMDLTEADVDEWFRTATPQNMDMGPYQPQINSGMAAKPQSDDRMGASGASRSLNKTQQQNRAGGKSSPKQK